MAKKAKKGSISATAKSLAKNFGKLAVDVQRVALSEMVAVYARASSTTRKTPKAKKVKNAKKSPKKQKRAKRS
jgi:hypothetical protein